MTYLELKTLLGVRLEDPSAVRWTSPQQPDALNQVYEDFCARTECVQQLVTLAQSSGAVYAPSGVRLVRLTGLPQSATLRRKLEPTTADDAFDMDPDWEAREENPRFFIFPWTQASGVKTLRVVFTPEDALTDLKVQAVILPARMSADGDIPAIPPEDHDCLVDGAAAYLLSQPGRMQNLDLAQSYGGRYEAKIAARIGMSREAFQTQQGSIPWERF